MNKEIIDKIKKFRDERNWKQFHNPKDLAISINLEASELLENFQWSGAELTAEDRIENIKEELADVMMYCVLMADAINADIETIIKKKLEKNEKKYEVDKAYGCNKKYTDLR